MASFEGIKVGDEVVIYPPRPNRVRYVAKVEHVTRTQFVAGGYRFRKNGGSHIGGDGWHFANAHHLTPELLAAVNAECRYLAASKKLYQLRKQLEFAANRIGNAPDCLQFTETMEAAAVDVAAAVAKLQEVVK